MGIELEFQIVDPISRALVSRAKDLIRNVKESAYKLRITPEITQSMIEMNTSIHHSAHEMLDELFALRDYLLAEANSLDIAICGGGTHPFQKWSMQKIFPTKRYKNLSRKFRYLSKRATVFGQHIHIGCRNREEALFLSHAMARYVPQLIALSASSPFYQGADTGYSSSRSTVFSAFPLSGVMPYLVNWNEFSTYFYKMRNFGIISSMKDFYWDIRPKPEFGTVEIRVCDTPLTFRKAVEIAAYIQAVSHYLLEEKPVEICQDLYFLYNYNRFQASRYGFDGDFINPYTGEHISISEDILDTVKIIEKYIDQSTSKEFIAALVDDVVNARNDAILLRKIYKQVGSFPKLVTEQCKAWSQ